MNQKIIMNFTVPPSADDLLAIADDLMESLPDELIEFCDSLAIEIEEVCDEAIEDELDLDDPFDLVALYRNGKQISPGVESKVANDDDILILYRRPLLDVWCESGEDLTLVVREAMIEEIAKNFDFDDDEIDEMTKTHFQGML